MQGHLHFKVIHKVVAVDEWCGGILTEVDQSCPHCGSRAMELVRHMLFSCPLAQQMWCYVVNIIWQLFAKRGNLGPWKSLLIM